MWTVKSVLSYSNTSLHRGVADVLFCWKSGGFYQTDKPQQPSRIHYCLHQTLKPCLFWWRHKGRICGGLHRLHRGRAKVKFEHVCRNRGEDRGDGWISDEQRTKRHTNQHEGGGRWGEAECENRDGGYEKWGGILVQESKREGRTVGGTSS